MGPIWVSHMGSIWVLHLGYIWNTYGLTHMVNAWVLYMGFPTIIFQKKLGVVSSGEGVMYLTSLGRPTDIGLQLGKACYPCSR